jgi:DNA-binding transcriptional LysR family regulator
MSQALLTQQVELGILYLPPMHPSLEIRPIHPNRIVAVMPESHPLAARKEIHPADLVNEPLIGYSSDIPLNQLILQLFDSEEAQPSPRIEVQQSHVACAMVQAGLGLALVDEITIRGPAWSQVAVRPMATTVAATINICYPIMEPLSRLAREFIAILESLDTDKG